MKKEHCMIPDCPALTGGKCWREIPENLKEAVRELRDVRKVYDDFEAAGLVDTTEGQKFVTWRGWKMIRNVITDRIEQITGSRV